MLTPPWGVKVWTLRTNCNHDATIYFICRTRERETECRGLEVVGQVSEGWKALVSREAEAPCWRGQLQMWREGCGMVRAGGLACCVVTLHGRDWRPGQARQVLRLSCALLTELFSSS